jgi:hypothetical protein
VGYRDVYGRRVGGLLRCLWGEGRWTTEMYMEGGAGRLQRCVQEEGRCYAATEM